MSAAVPAERLVLDVAGPVAVVPGRIAAWLCDEGGLDALRVRVRGQNAEVDQTLLAIRLTAERWREQRAALVAEQQRKLAEAGRESGPKVMSTATIADRLYVSDRAVRQWIATGRLRARRRGRRWEIARADFEEFKALRVA